MTQPIQSSSSESPVQAPQRDIVLAFSGGLDTSFCVPYLKERGWSVHTLFADTGGVGPDERAYIETRAKELGVASHVTIDCGRAKATRVSIRCWFPIAT
jgi:argininosuccinate synthase